MSYSVTHDYLIFVSSVCLDQVQAVRADRQEAGTWHHPRSRAEQGRYHRDRHSRPWLHPSHLLGKRQRLRHSPFACPGRRCAQKLSATNALSLFFKGSWEIGTCPCIEFSCFCYASTARSNFVLCVGEKCSQKHFSSVNDFITFCCWKFVNKAQKYIMCSIWFPIIFNMILICCLLWMLFKFSKLNNAFKSFKISIIESNYDKLFQIEFV